VSPALAIDTSVAIPLLVQKHSAHRSVVRWWAGRRLALAGHAIAETYAVLTRLPHDLRLAPGDAARLLAERFDRPLLLSDETACTLPSVLAHLGIAGGAT
jgi:toxin FitB